MEESLGICERKLREDNTLNERTSMDVTTIVRLLRFCLTRTAFQFKGTHYQQLDGVAMGSPVSPVIADISMADLEEKAFATMKNRASGGDLWTMSLRLSQRRPEINCYNI